MVSYAATAGKDQLVELEGQNRHTFFQSDRGQDTDVSKVFCSPNKLLILFISAVCEDDKLFASGVFVYMFLYFMCKMLS